MKYVCINVTILYITCIPKANFSDKTNQRKIKLMERHIVLMNSKTQNIKDVHFLQITL